MSFLERTVGDPDRFRVILQGALSNGYVKASCGILAGLFVLRKANKMLNQASLNNFTRDKYDWRREIVVVTGGSGGLGDMLVRKLVKQGIKVISLDIVPPSTPLPSNAFFYQIDITSTSSIKKVADEIRRDHGDPTILVNNAGAMLIKPILDDSEEGLRRVFDVNIVANFFLIQEFLPSMIKNNHGHIINIASLASYVTGVLNVSYSCTKAGVLALHEGLAQELVHFYKAPKIRTSIIHPTYVRTALIEKVWGYKKFPAFLLEPEVVVDKIYKQILSGNSGQVFIPGSYVLAAAMRGWPAWLQGAIRKQQKDTLIHS